ncbi:MAG TPA: hypothetical protein VJB70_03480 [Candidatus Paceibacterota bacterium]
MSEYPMPAKAPSEARGTVETFVLLVFVSIVISSIAMAIERTKYSPGITIPIGVHSILSKTFDWNGGTYKCPENFIFYTDGLCRGNQSVSGRRIESKTTGGGLHPCFPPAYRNPGDGHCSHPPIRVE